MAELVSAIASTAGLVNNSTNYQVVGQAQNFAEPAPKIEAPQKVSIDSIVQALQSYIDSNSTSLDISVNKTTGDIVVKVISDEDGSLYFLYWLMVFLKQPSPLATARSASSSGRQMCLTV